MKEKMEKKEKSIVETNFPRKRPLIGGFGKTLYLYCSVDCQNIYMFYVIYVGAYHIVTC